MSAFRRRPGEQATSSTSSSTTTSTAYETGADRSAIIESTRRATPEAYANAFGHFTEANIEEQGLGGGGHERNDGVHGLEGRGSMVQSSGNGGRSGARDAAKKAQTMSAAERKYGGTFGGQRLWGDGSGEAFFGEGPGWKDSRGHASDGPAPGAPIPYPAIGLGASGAPSVANVKFMATPAHNMSSSPTMTQGDSAGTNMGVASGTAMAPSRSATAAFTTLVGGGGTTETTPASTSTTNAGRPREDQDSGGGAVVLSAADGHAQASQIIRSMSTHGRGGDGRGDRDSSSSTDGGTTTTQRERAGGERATEASGGTVAWRETALKINRLVNPGAA